jgi:hypothetical protein
MIPLSPMPDDVLYKALENAGILSGNFVAPNIFDGVNPDEYAILITAKPPW